MKRQPYWGQTPSGFTFVELVISLSLIGLVAGTCLSVFVGGFQVWSRIQEYETQDQWIQVTFHQMRRDLRNARLFGPVPFQGEYDEFSFAGVVPIGEKEGKLMEEMGRVGYYFDGRRKVLCRSEQPFRNIREKGLRDSGHRVLSEVEKVRFSYYAPDPLEGDEEWVNRWEEKELPIAMKVVIQYVASSTGQPKEETLIVHLPRAAVR